MAHGTLRHARDLRVRQDRHATDTRFLLRSCCLVDRGLSESPTDGSEGDMFASVSGMANSRYAGRGSINEDKPDGGARSDLTGPGGKSTNPSGPWRGPFSPHRGWRIPAGELHWIIRTLWIGLGGSLVVGCLWIGPRFQALDFHFESGEQPGVERAHIQPARDLSKIETQKAVVSSGDDLDMWRHRVPGSVYTQNTPGLSSMIGSGIRNSKPKYQASLPATWRGRELRQA